MYEEIKPMGQRVAYLLDFVSEEKDKMPVLVTRRYPKSGIVRIQGSIKMPIFLNDILETGSTTQLVLEFLIGGRAGMGPNTKATVVSQRAIEAIGNQLVIKAGKVWAKIDKQKSQLQIQTNGGVIGIEG